MRQVLDGKRDQVVVAVTFNAQLGRNRRAGGNNQFGRFEPNDELGTGSQLNLAESIDGLRHLGAIDYRFRPNRDLGQRLGRRLLRVGRGRITPLASRCPA